MRDLPLLRLACRRVQLIAPFGFFVKESAVLYDTAEGRRRVGGDFDQSWNFPAGQLERFIFSLPIAVSPRAKRTREFILRNNYLFHTLRLACGMRVLLKQTDTGRFLKDSERWTEHSTEALDFKTTPSAMDFSQIHGFRRMGIVIKFSDPHYDLELKNCC